MLQVVQMKKRLVRKILWTLPSGNLPNQVRFLGTVLGDWTSRLAYRVFGHVNEILGDTIDIHGGGADLEFPHHTNEIAQSEAKTGKTFANYWMHNGFVNIDNVKMSKSLGNFITVHDALKTIDGQVLRFFFATQHYRKPINFTEKQCVMRRLISSI